MAQRRGALTQVGMVTLTLDSAEMLRSLRSHGAPSELDLTPAGSLRPDKDAESAEMSAEIGVEVVAVDVTATDAPQLCAPACTRLQLRLDLGRPSLLRAPLSSRQFAPPPAGRPAPVGWRVALPSPLGGKLARGLGAALDNKTTAGSGADATALRFELVAIGAGGVSRAVATASLSLRAVLSRGTDAVHEPLSLTDPRGAPLGTIFVTASAVGALEAAAIAAGVSIPPRRPVGAADGLAARTRAVISLQIAARGAIARHRRRLRQCSFRHTITVHVDSLSLPTALARPEYVATASVAVELMGKTIGEPIGTSRRAGERVNFSATRTLPLEGWSRAFGSLRERLRSGKAPPPAP